MSRDSFLVVVVVVVVVVVLVVVVVVVERRWGVGEAVAAAAAAAPLAEVGQPPTLLLQAVAAERILQVDVVQHETARRRSANPYFCFPSAHEEVKQVSSYYFSCGKTKYRLCDIRLENYRTVFEWSLRTQKSIHYLVVWQPIYNQLYTAAYILS